MKKVCNCVLILLGMMVIGFTLIMLSFTIPTNWTNICDSAVTISSEGGHQTMGLWDLDNFMDDMIINQSTCDKPDSTLVDKTINIWRVKYIDSEYGYTMDRFCNGDDSYCYKNYPIYWHGYIFIIRPLLLFLNFNQIRTLNTILQVSLFIYIFMLLIKKGLKRYAVAYILMYYLISPVATGFSLQYTFIYYISLISSILLIKYYDYINKKNLIVELFLCQGALISFFDILTYPAFSISVLLITMLILIYDTCEDLDYVKVIIKCFWCTVSWCVGYVFLWALKWILSDIINGNLNITREAFYEVLYRSADSYGDQQISAIDVIVENISHYNDKMFILPVLVAVFYVVYKKRLKLTNDNLIHALSFIIVAMYPIVWYVSFKQHSYLHAWYACRSLAASACALLCGLVCVLETKDSK